MHSLGYLHCDLNPSNILVNKFLFPKLCDFGLSRKISNEINNKSAIQGTIGYVAPEIIIDTNYNIKGDVYSFGMVLYELLIQIHCFKSLSQENYMYKYIFNEYRPPNKDNKIQEPYWNLIKKCWDVDPNKRPTFDDIVDELLKPDFISTGKIYKNAFECYKNIIENQASIGTFKRFPPKIKKTKLKTKKK